MVGKPGFFGVGLEYLVPRIVVLSRSGNNLLDVMPAAPGILGLLSLPAAEARLWPVVTCPEFEQALVRLHS